MIGICGDDCSFCPRYEATQNGTIEDLERVKVLWVRLGFRDPDFPVHSMACQGCKPENKCAYSELRACAIEKGVDNCGLCQEYPCGLIASAFEISENLYPQVVRVCEPNEMDMLKKAFFSKRQNLDRLHLEMKEKK